MSLIFHRTKVALAVVVTVLVIVSGWLIDHRAEAQVAVITIDPSVTFQTISGWEATADIPDTPNTPEWADYADEILDRAVNDVGLNRIRLEIRAGAENTSGEIRRFISGQSTYDEWKKFRYQTVNDNDDPLVINWDGFDFAELDWHLEHTVIPFRDRLTARGERLGINLCYVAFRSGEYVHKDPEEYAELVLATYLHMRDEYGFVPDTWEVILEPDLKPDMWNGEQIGEAMVATSRRLIENGFAPAFVVPSVTNMRNAVPYMKDIEAVPGAMEHVVELSYHRYRGGNRTTLGRIAKYANEHDIQPSMLEWWFGRGNYKVLHEDLKIGLNTAWQGRVLNGHFRLQRPNSDNPILRLQHEVRYNLQYFRYIRAGAVRIGARSSKEKRMDPLAFVNLDGSTTVVIKAKREGDVVVRGLPAGQYGVSYAVTGDSKELLERVTVAEGDELRASIPGEGVLTVSAWVPLN